MKYISFAIPCYNSEAYMEKAINSILVGGEDVEIIVVNDGSKDGTQEIAERYQEKYPTIVKAVAKPNGGHGDAVNCGLEHATGKYFKVVDSDDWVDEEALYLTVTLLRFQTVNLESLPLKDAKNLEKQSTTISSSGDLKLTKISKTLLPVMDI